MHVDGFRFDLAAILNRDEKGNLLAKAPVLDAIAEDPVLAATKIIAEPWDAGGAYQVGCFPGRWAEWNDRYRDDMRRFWHGEKFFAMLAATRFAGSDDLYRKNQRKPYHSINYMACHDGFTLNDVVSYSYKHNEANGWNNNDGADNNCSYNYGFEGPTVNPVIESLREKQIKNMFLSLMVSQGTPMLLAGDELRRTKSGNNNTYCQDNELSWLDWSLKEKNAGLFRFFRLAIQLRNNHIAFRRTEFFDGIDHSGDRVPDILWLDQSGKPIDWKRGSNFLAFYIDGQRSELFSDHDDTDFFIICNADYKDVTITIPAPSTPDKIWCRCADTSIPSPDDFLEPGHEEALDSLVYVLPARSMVVLIANIKSKRNL
jgi:glycogen operon protein